MESPQPVISPLKNSVMAEPKGQKSDFFMRTTGSLYKGTGVTSNETAAPNLSSCIGVLDVYIHQARDIHNICIYQNQDVYAKFCLTSDPETVVSTKIINGGGKNPVFAESIRFYVRTVESSLKCEIWMLSRVKNYLEDQLLGFALVPLSEVILKNGMLEKEFSLSSTDLFHSPAGFVQLSLSYCGSSPDVMAIPTLSDAVVQDSKALPCELDKIEFPDPNIENENECMVSEYFEISCSSMDSDRKSKSLATLDEGSHLNSGMGAAAGSFTKAAADSVQHPKRDSPPSSVSTSGISSPGVPSPLVAASSQSFDNQSVLKSPDQEHISAAKEKTDIGEAQNDSCGGISYKTLTKPVVSANIEPEQKMVQQDIVDMYMKSMQQFTESLAKMKLPFDIDTGPTNSENSKSDNKVQPSKDGGSRVFYGSRAFF